MKKKYKLLRGMITFIPDMSHGHYTFQFSMTDQLKPMALHKRWGNLRSCVQCTCIDLPWSTDTVYAE